MFKSCLCYLPTLWYWTSYLISLSISSLYFTVYNVFPFNTAEYGRNTSTSSGLRLNQIIGFLILYLIIFFNLTMVSIIPLDSHKSSTYGIQLIGLFYYIGLNALIYTEPGDVRVFYLTVYLNKDWTCNIKILLIAYCLIILEPDSSFVLCKQSNSNVTELLWRVF